MLCQKPGDLSLARAQACQMVVAQNGRPVKIGFNRRFDPNFAALKSAVIRGEIGRPELLSITSFDPAPPPVASIKGTSDQRLRLRRDGRLNVAGTPLLGKIR